MYQALKKVAKHISAPLLKEFFFFATIFVLISATLLANTIRSIIDCDFFKDFPLLAKGFSWSVFVSYVLTWLVYITKSRFLKYFFYIILVGLFSFNLYLRLAFGLTLSPLIILIIGETNTKEAGEFASTFLTSSKAIITYVIVFLAIALLIFEKKLNRFFEKFLSKKYVSSIATILLLLLLLGGVLQIGKLPSLLRCDSIDELEKWSDDNNPLLMDYVTGCVYALKGPFVAGKENKKAVDASKKIINERHTWVGDSVSPVTVVFILGESYIKHHASIYGYCHETTPVFAREMAQGNLFAFTDVVSPFNATTDVAKNTFSCNSIADGEHWYDKPFFPIVFRQAGFDVEMYDNQADFELNANFTFSLNSFLYGNDIKSMAYTYLCPNTFTYDGELVNHFLKRYKAGKKNTLAILHLLGQHIETKERYPLTQENIHFTRDSIHRKESYMNDYKRFLIASYDNATYYNDRVIGNLFDSLRETNAVVVYFSDHGDEVYDYRDSQGRLDGDDYANLLKYQFEVPFMIWCSDTYKALHPELVDAIRSSLNKPYMLDLVSHTFFHLADISTPCYINDRDITSTNYKTRKRVVESPERKYDYDSIVSRKTKMQ